MRDLIIAKRKQLNEARARLVKDLIISRCNI